MSNRAGKLSLSIQNRTEALTTAMDQVETFLDASAIDPGDRAQIMVILDEIASNAIKAAWPEGGDHVLRVEIEIAGDPAVLQMLAIDDGIEFDPTNAPPPDLEAELDDRDPGGLGLFMVMEMSDSVEYTRTAGENHLRVTKALQPAA